MSVLIETTLGDVVVDLFTDTHPVFCKSFLKLCKLKYYNNHLFFNVVSNRFAQAGDPTATGLGGESLYSLLSGLSSHRFIRDEGRPLTPLELQSKGLLIATKLDNRPDTNGSQFTITTAAGPGRGLHEMGSSFTSGFRCFGVVAEDASGVLAGLNGLFLDDDGRPLTDVRVLHTLVIADPFPDPEGFSDLEARFCKAWERPATLDDCDVSSPRAGRPAAEKLPHRISASLLSDDPSFLAEGEEDPEQAAARQLASRKKAAESRAVVLEMLGDVASAEAAPPERVLFVCKLNPVTTGADMELVFSRFDDDVKADVIYDDRDRSKSLCYAFVTFSSKEKCEAAYLKMDGALVDDRRIKVDFSQSSSGQWRKYEAAKRGSGGNVGSSHNNNRSNNNNNAPRGGGQPPPPPPKLATNAPQQQWTPPNKSDDGGENRPMKSSRWGPAATVPVQQQQQQPQQQQRRQDSRSADDREDISKRDSADRDLKRGRERSRSAGSDRSDSLSSRSSSRSSRSSSSSSSRSDDSERRSRDKDRSSHKKHKKEKKEKKHKHKHRKHKHEKRKHEKKEKKEKKDKKDKREDSKSP